MVVGQYVEYDNDVLECETGTAVGRAHCVQPVFDIEYPGSPRH